MEVLMVRSKIKADSVSDVEAAVKKMVHGYSRLETFEDGYFELLDQGKIDAFIYDFPYAQEEIKPFAGRLEMVQYNLTKSTYNVGVRRGAAQLEKVLATDLDAAWAIGEAFPDQDFSIVDRRSFAVMERLGLGRAASFDGHFAIYRFGRNRDRAFEILR